MHHRINRHSDPHTHPHLIVLLAVTIPVLALANIILSAKVSHIGFQLADINETRLDLTKYNQDLEEEIYKISALTLIYAKAEALGFNADNEYLDVPIPPPVAYHLD